MESVAPFQDIINKEIQRRLESPEFQSPHGLYAPSAYILKNGGKRVRASLVLMSAKMFTDYYMNALPVALAFETFHNFTLIHDDIMDAALIRRGQPTIHEMWDTNTAILSGDATMIMAYRFFEDAQEFVPKLFPLLNKTALEVCEGQQYDIDLENANLTDEIVTEEMYIKMIELKTSVLLAACLKAGAVIGLASQDDADKLYEIGRLLGIAFQLQDDILDSYGNQETFGKKIGGDISENKKTFLVVKALQELQEEDKKELLQLYSDKNISNKFERVIALFNKANVKEIALEKVTQYFNNALDILKQISLSPVKKGELLTFIEELRERDF